MQEVDATVHRTEPRCLVRLDSFVPLRRDTETWMLVGMRISANSLIDEHIQYNETDTFRTRKRLHDYYWSF